MKRRFAFALCVLTAALLIVTGVPVFAADMPQDEAEYWDRLAEATGMSVTEYQAASASKRAEVMAAWNRLYSWFTNNIYTVEEANTVLEDAVADDTRGSALVVFSKGHEIRYYWDSGEEKDLPALKALKSTLNNFTSEGISFYSNRLRPMLKLLEKQGALDNNLYSPLEMGCRIRAFLVRRKDVVGKFTIDPEYHHSEEGIVFKVICAIAELDFDSLYSDCLEVAQAGNP